MSPNSAMYSDSYSAPLRAPIVRVIANVMRPNRLLAALFAVTAAAAPAGWANDPFTERCIALKARLAALDCKRLFTEAHAVLSDAKPYLSNVAQELLNNRARLVALSDLLKDTSRATQHCIGNVAGVRAVAQAYISVDHLYVKLNGWVAHKWEFPADFARDYQRDLMDKYTRAFAAFQSVKEQL